MRPLRITDASSVIGLQQEIQRSEESRYDHRLHGVLLVAQGMTCPEVARLLGDAPRSVEYWVHHFERQGLGGLVEGERSGRPSRLNQQQIKEINHVLRAKPSDAGMRVNLWDGKTLSAWINKTYGIQLGVRQCQRLFRQFEFRLRKPRPLLAKSDPGRQKKHKKKLRKLMKDDSFDLWALDEVHFQQQGSRCRMWVPPETKDPVVYHHPTRKSVGYFAAVRLRDGLFLFRRETGRFNGESFWEFLKVFKEASAVGGRRVLAISDNAQYHRSKLHLNWRLEQAPEFGLDFLPPYSPELNPIERVWKLTRRLCLHNRYFAFLDSVVDAVETQFADWTKPNDVLRRLCAII